MKFVYSQNWQEYLRKSKKSQSTKIAEDNSLFPESVLSHPGTLRQEQSQTRNLDVGGLSSKDLSAPNVAGVANRSSDFPATFPEESKPKKDQTPPQALLEPKKNALTAPEALSSIETTVFNERPPKQLSTARSKSPSIALLEARHPAQVVQGEPSISGPVHQLPTSPAHIGLSFVDTSS